MNNFCTSIIISVVILSFVLFTVILSDINYEVIHCENTDLNISCENDSTILIQKVQFGPVSYEMDTFDERERINQQLINNSNIMDLCNGKKSCLLNNTESWFLMYPALPRKIYLSYKCDRFEFTYIGCFEDNVKRLFTGKYIRETKNMSAHICRHFCSTENNMFPYFGTENYDECFCGYTNELYKLRTDLYEETPYECYAICSQHYPETCGDFARISVYRNILGMTKSIKINTEEIFHTSKLCLQNEKPIDVKLTKYQISSYCEESKSENCESNKGICWQRNIMPLNEIYKLDLLNLLEKYVKINYSCQDPVLNLLEQTSTFDADAKQQTIGILSGVLIAVCFIGVTLIGLCIYKRKQQHRLKNRRHVPNNEIQHLPDQDINEYVNIRGNEHPYSNMEAVDSKDTYSVVFKTKQTRISHIEGNENACFSSPEDVYLATSEGVYDISNKPRYKEGDEEQGIYSHTTEDVYDSATLRNKRNPKEEENLYDQGFHQPVVGNDD